MHAQVLAGCRSLMSINTSMVVPTQAAPEAEPHSLAPFVTG